MNNTMNNNIIKYLILLMLCVNCCSYLTNITSYKDYRSNYMDCGISPYCGVLTLETGDGDGNYHHQYPQLHGLWPQVPDYGNSNCVTPPGNKSIDVEKYMNCYTDPSFAQHEWTTHGFCADNNPESFFNQACTLAVEPLETMTQMKENGNSLEEMATALENEGYGVVFIDTSEFQIELSCCAGNNGEWKMSTITNFSKQCI